LSGEVFEWLYGGLENGEVNVSFVYSFKKLHAAYIFNRSGKSKTDWCSIGIRITKKMNKLNRK
jgi:hypothetical protein